MSNRNKDDEALKDLSRAGMGDVKSSDRTLYETTRRTPDDSFNAIERATAATGRQYGDLKMELGAKTEIAKIRDERQKLLPYRTSGGGRSTRKP